MWGGGAESCSLQGRKTAGGRRLAAAAACWVMGRPVRHHSRPIAPEHGCFLAPPEVDCGCCSGVAQAAPQPRQSSPSPSGSSGSPAACGRGWRVARHWSGRSCWVPTTRVRGPSPNPTAGQALPKTPHLAGLEVQQQAAVQLGLLAPHHRQVRAGVRGPLLRPHIFRQAIQGVVSMGFQDLLSCPGCMLGCWDVADRPKGRPGMPGKILPAT